MKNKILSIILIFILIILTIYFFIYKINNNNISNNNFNQNKENFLNSTDYSFLGLNSDNKLTFYNKLDSLYYSTQKNNDIITNFLYNNKMLIIFSIIENTNQISYCNNCDLSSEYSMNKINLFGEINNTPINNIAFDQEGGNTLFILLNNNKLYILKNFDTALSTILISTFPLREDYFINFDAKYGKLVGIGNKTNFIYQTDINRTNLSNNFKNATWNILDKTRHIFDIKITLYGYIGKGWDGKFYLCNQFNNYKWTLITDLPQNSVISNIEGISSEGISMTINLDNNNYLYIYDESKSQFTQITTLNDEIKLNQTKVIDYIYPVITTVPELEPLDTASMVANNDNIKNEKNEKYGQMINLLTEIDKKINAYYTNQQKFNENELDKKINDRNQNIVQFKKDIGKSEAFANIISIDFNKINKKFTVPPTNDIIKNKKPPVEDLIINYP